MPYPTREETLAAVHTLLRFNSSQRPMNLIIGTEDEDGDQHLFTTIDDVSDGTWIRGKPYPPEHYDPYMETSAAEYLTDYLLNYFGARE
jgi:hypothetical protein